MCSLCHQVRRHIGRRAAGRVRIDQQRSRFRHSHDFAQARCPAGADGCFDFRVFRWRGGFRLQGWRGCDGHSEARCRGKVVQTASFHEDAASGDEARASRQLAAAIARVYAGTSTFPPAPAFRPLPMPLGATMARRRSRLFRSRSRPSRRTPMPMRPRPILRCRMMR